MSLKAKIEAVVYAAEEPVTLAQLAVLFSEEALEWKREHEVAPEPANEAAEPVAEQVPLPDNVDGEEIADDEVGLQPAEGEPELHAEQPAPDPAAEAAEATTEELVAAADAAALSAESDAKRAAKQRDRDVREVLRGLLDELVEEYAKSDRGIEIREIAGGYRVGTKPEYHDSVRSFVKSLKPPMKLSLQALETLAVIAYKQPVTAARGKRDTRRGLRRRAGKPDQPQADYDCGTQAGDRQADPLQDHEGIPTALWLEGRERVAQH